MVERKKNRRKNGVKSSKIMVKCSTLANLPVLWLGLSREPSGLSAVSVQHSGDTSPDDRLQFAGGGSTSVMRIGHSRRRDAHRPLAGPGARGPYENGLCSTAAASCQTGRTTRGQPRMRRPGGLRTAAGHRGRQAGLFGGYRRVRR